MFCTQCGRQLPDVARFCDICGSPSNSNHSATQGNNQGETYLSSLLEEEVSPGKLLFLSSGVQIILPVEGKVLLGRRDDEEWVWVDIDLTPLDPQQYASRRHAEIEVYFGDYILRDMNSRNGTFVNGRKLIPNEEVLLKDQDRLAFGLVAATFVR